MSLKNFLFVLLIIVGSLPSKATTKPLTVISPDKKIRVNFYSDNGVSYDIAFSGETVLQKSKLGITLKDADLANDLRLTTATPAHLITDNYTLIYGKKTAVKYTANEVILHCLNQHQQALDIIFRVSNDGVAFRYFIPGKANQTQQVLGEYTTFRFPVDTRAWLQPMQVAKSGWMQTNPAYEEYFTQNIPTGTPSPTAAGWVYPGLFKYHTTWIVLTEAAVDTNYCATRLLTDSVTKEYYVGFPSGIEVMTGQGNLPEGKTPFYSPWRVIGIGSLKSIMQSTIGTDLAAAKKIKETAYILPGKSSWSWINSKDDSIVYSEQKRYIDFAAKMNWRYCLVDADWDRKIGYEKITELVAYAKAKNVGIWLWYNSAGDWNTVQYTPKNKLLTVASRRAEFKRLQEMGIKGIKIDFFGGDGRSVMQYYIDILNDAAVYHLMVNFHGTTLPRGLERTYPNLMTAEAVRGFENITFRQADADKEAQHCATLPFTRNLYDPMDFTPMNLYKIPTKIIRKTTSGFELALSVLFLSGVQHFAESPEGMSHIPDYVQQFLSKLPDHWDEVKFIDGFPGKYVVLARRLGKKWYIAGINGENQERTIKINMVKIIGYGATIITDSDKPLNFKQEKIQSGVINLTLRACGGFVGYN
ncbi:glycoside hydrolase family 97 protein [Mucilaginibacter sp.]|uniref:glycoside hydrolase family 97 protein n=1 Tax=Mucilaginibacter sp. TaxID=1882438 RepID=UPI00262F24CC|nr:glycoside hydrolase family 97 protein [Mucilaginibacter sp.]MDB4926124.1 glycoside hydrolase family 97 protein [Mucilaginibacter sp.]